MTRRSESPETKNRILKAFNTIMASNDFHRITVDDIVHEAGISRATFHRHFRDKYDVMNYNYTTLLNSALLRQGDVTMESLFAEMLKAGRSQRVELSVLFGTWGPDSLREYICSKSCSTARNIYETGDIFGNREARHRMNRRQEAQLFFFCHGAAAFFEEWVKGNIDMSTEEAAAIMYEFLPEIFRGNIWEL
jgi:AcrR family transcriptional regulator